MAVIGMVHGGLDALRSVLCRLRYGKPGANLSLAEASSLCSLARSCWSTLPFWALSGCVSSDRILKADWSSLALTLVP